MESSTSSLYLAVPIVVAGFATLWAVWPEKYVAWIQAMKQKMPPAMRAGADGVEAIFPLFIREALVPEAPTCNRYFDLGTIAVVCLHVLQALKSTNRTFIPFNFAACAFNSRT